MQEFWPIVIAVVVPIVIVSMLIGIISLSCRHFHKRRMDALLVQERRLLDEDGLRVQHVGESTLQVSTLCTQTWKCLEISWTLRM